MLAASGAPHGAGAGADAADGFAILTDDFPGSSWLPKDLTLALLGGRAERKPTMLARADGSHVLYPGKLHSLSGEPEAGKGWLVLLATHQLLAAGSRVLYIDFEDTEYEIVGRLLAMGARPSDILDGLRYLNPTESFAAGAVEVVDAALEETPALAVIDGVTGALTCQGLDLQSNADVAVWLTLLPRRIVRSGAAVVLVDHVVKVRENRGRYAIGAQHKLAGVDVALSLESVVPFGRGREGRSKLSVVKDRPGYLRERAVREVLGDLRVTPVGEGNVAVALDPPSQPGPMAASSREAVLMERVSRAVEERPGLGMKDLRRAVTGNHAGKDEAVRRLVEQGYVRMEDDGQAKRHFSERPFRQAAAGEGAPVPNPCPTGAQAPSEAHRAPVPLPLGGAGTGHRTEDPTQRPHEPFPRDPGGGERAQACSRQDAKN
jgi:hypothetical protein